MAGVLICSRCTSDELDVIGWKESKLQPLSV